MALVSVPGESIDGLMFGPNALLSSNCVLSNFINGNLLLSDGRVSYSGLQAVDVLRGAATTRPIEVDQPSNTNLCYIGAGDDLVNNVIGGGQAFTFSVAPSSSQVIDAFFLTSIYIEKCSVYYGQAALGSYLSVQEIVPANVVYPAQGNGNVDLVNGVKVPNTTNTGLYWVFNTPTVLNSFVSKLPLVKIAVEPINELNLLPAGHQLEITIFNNGTQTLDAYTTFLAYR